MTILTLIALLLWHALCDVFAQPRYKHERWDAMALHGAAHAILPGILLGWPFAVAEMAAHCLIDAAKYRLRFGHVVDQLLHVGCKVAWVLLAL